MEYVQGKIKYLFLVLISGIFLIVLYSGCAVNRLKTSQRNDEEIPSQVQQGDMVTVHCTGYLDNGEIFYTTREEIGRDPNYPKAFLYEEPSSFASIEGIAGKDFPFPGIAHGVIGLMQGDKKRLVLLSKDAYGPSDSKEIKQFPRHKRISKRVRLSAEEYAGRFNSFPAIGDEMDFVPYFKHKVVKIADDHVILEALAADNGKSEDAFGTTTIHSEGDEILLTLNPRPGAPFIVQDRQGIIISADEEMFTVDFNPPLSGKQITFELEVVSLRKASTFATLEIPWLEEYNPGFEKAKDQGKPIVLVLYAQWCAWSKRYREEVLNDPRIKEMKDRFVWIKIDSDTHREYYDLYHQDGYPLTLVLSPDGEVLKRMEGFTNVFALKKALQGGIDHFPYRAINAVIEPDAQK